MEDIWLGSEQVGDIENITKKTFKRRFKAGHYKTFRYVSSGKGGGRGGKKLEIALSCLSTEARARFFRSVEAIRVDPSEEVGIPEAAFDGFDRQPEYKKTEALRWLTIIEAFESYAKDLGQKKRCKAARHFVQLHRIDHPQDPSFSDKTLFRKIKEFRNSGIEGLINQLGNSHSFRSWPEEAQAYLFQKYCNINQPTASWCIGQLKTEAKKRRWNLPSVVTMRRYIQRIPQETRDYYRKGKRYWQEHYVPSVLRDYEEMDPGELYVADHAQINVAVKHPSGRILFPWLTAWKDMRSRKILGWVLADIPSSNTINLSLKYSIERYGAPEHVVLDNGRDFSAKHFTGGQTKRFRFKVQEDELIGIYKLLSIDPHFCIPANAQAKNIERWFWTQEQNFQKAFPTYRGNNIMNRPEGMDRRIAQSAKGKANYVLEWDDFMGCLDNYIKNYNQDHQHQGHGMDGRTPNQVWNEYFQTHAQRRVSPNSLRLLMMKSKRVKVGRFGINAFGERYRSSQLMDHQGHDVIYRYDPQDLNQIYIYKLDNSFLCIGQRTHRTAWDDEDAYHEIKKIEKKKLRAIKAQREAAENLVQVEFGYQKQEPSGEHEDKPAKTVRVLRTPLDGVQKEIDRESGIEHEPPAEPFNFREKFNEMTRRRLEERNRKKETHICPFKLNMPGAKE